MTEQRMPHMRSRKDIISQRQGKLMYKQIVIMDLDGKPKCCAWGHSTHCGWVVHRVDGGACRAFAGWFPPPRPPNEILTWSEDSATSTLAILVLPLLRPCCTSTRCAAAHIRTHIHTCTYRTHTHTYALLHAYTCKHTTQCTHAHT